MVACISNQRIHFDRSDPRREWQQLRFALQAHWPVHQLRLLPCQIEELRWIRAEIARVIGIFDTAYWKILGHAEALTAACSANSIPAPVLVARLGPPEGLDRRSRLDALLPYLTHGEWLDLKISQLITESVLFQLSRRDACGSQAPTSQIHPVDISCLRPDVRLDAQRLAQTFRGWANAIRIGSINPLGELERRVVLLLDLLGPSRSDNGGARTKHTGRGRPKNPANEARDNCLRELVEHLENKGDVTPKKLLEAAKAHPLVQELKQRFHVSLTYEVCRNVIAPAQLRRACH